LWKQDYTAQLVPHIDFPLPFVPRSPYKRKGALAAAKARHSASYNWDSGRTKLLALLADTGNVDLYSDDAEGRSVWEAPNRNFIANMPGEAYLAESTYQVEFFGGRFKNFIIEERPVFTGIPVGSFFSASHDIPFQQITSFSFEDGPCRGLREISQAVSSDFQKPCTVVTDYIFIEDYPYPFVSLHITYPKAKRAPTMLSYGFFEIPLFTFEKAEAVRLKVLYPDGQEYFCRINATEAIYEFPGTIFFFTCHGNTFMLMFPQYNQQAIEVLPVRVMRRKNTYVLLLNPRGSYRHLSSALFDGMVEHVPLILAASNREELTHVPPSEKTMSFLEQTWIGADYSSS
jgi:hypothetical protein